MKSFLKFLVLMFIISSGQSHGQGDYNRYWYFGAEAGLDFASPTPVVLTNGAMTAFEGCATISDPNGVLQFYTNGNIVWNRNHLPMPGGNGLNGDGAATQTAIIVPAPGNANEYYIFTVDTNGGPRGLCYSVVDMTLNGGLGDVTIKNIQLQTPVTEKLTAVRHANGIDAWVIVHDWNGASFYSYEITAAGINTVPVVSTVGMNHGGVFTNSHGYLKASSNARKIACAIRGSNAVEVFDFSNITGVISNPVTIPFTAQTYGIEFSPDNHYLYAATTTNPSDIYQFDVTLPAGSIPGSGTVIATHTGFIGAMQLARNDKIYVCQFQSTSLAMIDAPNLAGVAANYIPNALFLGGKTGQYGLPNFLQSFFIVADFTYADTCSGLATQFTTLFTSPDSVKWNFDDPASGTANFSTALNPQHTYSNPSLYTVELIVYQTLLVDTVRKTIEIFETPDPDLGPDRVSCTWPIPLDGGLYPNFPPATYLWSDGSIDQTLDVYADGIYWVEVTRLGCTGVDTVEITIILPPVVDIGPPQQLCEGDTLILDAENPGASYLWQDLSTQQTLTVITSGTYHVTVSAGICSESDTVDIVFNPAPQISLGNDTTLCTGLQLFLQGGFIPGAQYLWNDGSTGQGLFVDKGGEYSVTVSIGNCFDQDTVFIDEQSMPDVFLGDDQYLCAGQQFLLDATTYGANYVWQDGSTDSIFNPQVTGNYFVTVTNQCGTDADSIFMNFQDCLCPVYVPNAFTPNGDPTNQVFRFKQACSEFTSRFRIFNRLGHLIFETTDPYDGWDGNFDGQPAPEGVYLYEVKYRAFDSGKLVNETKRGTVSLIR